MAGANEASEMAIMTATASSRPPDTSWLNTDWPVLSSLEMAAKKPITAAQAGQGARPRWGRVVGHGMWYLC